ncbi:Uncharacterised protein [Streptococcus pneumoniae]|nr:Uncharacterised protein [Streptococcus pneumoniae]
MVKSGSKPILPRIVIQVLLHKLAQNVIFQHLVSPPESSTYLFLYLYESYKYLFHPDIALYYVQNFSHTVKRRIHAHPIPIHPFALLFPLPLQAYLLQLFVFLIAHTHDCLQNIIDLLPLFLHTSSSH